MAKQPKTWTDVKDEFISARYWWWVCFNIAFWTMLSALNKWVIHIPMFPKF